MTKSIMSIIILALFLCGCSDSETTQVKVSTDEGGNTVYEAETGDGKSVGIVPSPGELNSLKEVSELGDFRVGQVWTYETRDGEENSRVTILRLEQNPKIGGIVHVSLNGLKIPNATAPDGFTEEASHLPFSEKAIIDSVVELQSSVEVSSEHTEGYEIWRSAFEQGKAGVFTTSLVEGIEFLEDIFRRASPQQVDGEN